MRLGTIPRRFNNASIESWRERTGNDRVANRLEKYLSEADGMYETGTGLMLTGAPGVGKTYLACAVIGELMPKYQCEFWPLHAYQRAVRTQMTLRDAWSKAGDDEAYREWFQISKHLRLLRTTCDFVVFDDIGMEYRSDSGWIETEFETTFRWRFDNALPTFVTSNQGSDEWARYGRAMPDFLKEACIQIEVIGDSLR